MPMILPNSMLVTWLRGLVSLFVRDTMASRMDGNTG